MSLFDALFLDPHPFNVCVAVRGDGVKGTGTISDPYNGSPKLAAAHSVTLTRAEGSNIAMAAAAGHGLQSGDTVQIKGAGGADANLWNGIFTISNVAGTSFEYPMDGVPAASPAVGAITVAKAIGANFDDVMNELPSNALLHVRLASGVFLTNGYADEVMGGWQPRPGMRLQGSGVGVTTLKLINATVANKHYFAIGHALGTGSNPVQPNRMDAFEVSDLTIDSNLAGNGSVACGAIRIMGHHSRVHRVKAINWGTKSTAKPCYVIAVITANPGSNVTEIVDAGMEDCIVVQPGPSVSGGKVTLLHAGGMDDVPTDAEGYGSVPFIRQCFADCLPLTGSADLGFDYRGLSMGWCRGGIVEGNQVHNMKIAGPYQRDATTRDIVLRNNTFRNVVRGPFWDLGTVYPASPLTLVDLNQDMAADSSGKTAVATTNASPSVPHPYRTGDRVRITTGSPSSPYDGVFVVKEAAPNKFRYVMASNPGAPATAPAKHQKVFGAGKLLVEGNAIALSTSAASFAVHFYDQKIMEDVPTNVVGEVIVRNNKIRYVDGAFDPAYTGDGILVNGATNAIVADNVVETAPVNPIQLFRCRNVTTQNNRTPSGALIEGYNPDTARRYPELETENDFALVMSLFNRRAQ